jgi:hypothetical protein
VLALLLNKLRLLIGLGGIDSHESVLCWLFFRRMLLRRRLMHRNYLQCVPSHDVRGCAKQQQLANCWISESCGTWKSRKISQSAANIATHCRRTFFGNLKWMGIAAVWRVTRLPGEHAARASLAA